MKAMIIGIDHVQITVPANSITEARSFYCGLLRLPEIEKPEILKSRGGFWLQVGDRQVHIGAEDSVQRQSTKAHVAYAVDNLAAWRQQLAASGIEILEGLPIPGYERFEFRDPFGNRVEFIKALA